VRYEFLIDSILRTSTIATVLEETADDLDPATVKEMAKAMRERLVQCLMFGGFDEEDVEAIHKEVLASMHKRPDA
jgi:hypothetical protein